MQSTISSEPLSQPNLEIAGFQLWIHDAYIEGPYDWIKVTAHCGAKGADVWTSDAILILNDIISLRDACDSLLSGKSQQITVSPLERDIELLLRKADNLGHFDFVVMITPDRLSQKHEFTFTIDQSYLSKIISDCNEIILSISR